MRSLPLLLVSGSLALFAAGCGGDDNKDTDSAARGYDETGQALNDICKRAEAETDPIGAKVTGEAGKADADALQQLVDLNEKYIAEVKDVVPDPKLKSAYDGFVAGLDRMQELTIEAANAAKAGDKDGLQSAARQIGELDKENDGLGKALGAPDCAKD